MRQVGEKGDLPEDPRLNLYQKQLDQNASKFLNALESYQGADADDRIKLKSIMDQSLLLIRSAVNEIKYGEVYQQEMKVEKDYKAYMNDPSSENLSALEEDLSTLKNYSDLK